MWKCQKCGERIEDTFETCWSCGTGKDGSPPEDPVAFQEGKQATEATKAAEDNGKDNKGAKTKVLGTRLCLIGSGTAILFPPIKFMGTNLGWHFIFEDVGFGAKAINFIDLNTLLLELILINGIGIALYFIGDKQSGLQVTHAARPSGHRNTKRGPTGRREIGGNSERASRTRGHSTQRRHKPPSG